MSADAPASRSILSGRLRLHYTDWGHDGAPLLLLVHGGNDHGRSWDAAARALRDRWHVIAPDLRGHGDSAWAEDGHYSVTASIGDMAALIAALGGGPVAMIAHSFGGMVALRHAGIFPETLSRLLVIEGLGPTDEQMAAQRAIPAGQRIRTYIERQHALAVREPRLYASIEEAAQRMIARNPRLSPEQALHLTGHAVRRMADGRYGWKFDPRVGPLSPIDITPEERDRIRAAITCPVLLVHGAESWLPDPAGTARLAPFRDVRTATVAGAGHWVQHDRLEDLLALAVPFLG